MEELKNSTQEVLYCEHCGAEITNNDYSTIDGKIICESCVESYTVTCDHCNCLVWDSDCISDSNTVLCPSCYENCYTRCYNCDDIIHYDDSYEYNGEYYCSSCYNEIEENTVVREYSYKPDPIFYGTHTRYFGVELEIDIAGSDDDNADKLLNIGNKNDEHIYIKSDGSLNDGMEIVSHPMTLEYHKQYCWDEIMSKAIRLGYRSHQTTTCGLHIHVNRKSLGSNTIEQEDVISRILYFVEHHWNELLKFSRRSEYTMNRWAARYGYDSDPKAILDKAKSGNCGRYVAVNLCNSNTIEFRMFRGSLKYNTMIATLQMVNKICEVAISMSDEDMKSLSWSHFVSTIEDEELIEYLKERRLYVNEEVTELEEF